VVLASGAVGEDPPQTETEEDLEDLEDLPAPGIETEEDPVVLPARGTETEEDPVALPVRGTETEEDLVGPRVPGTETELDLEGLEDVRAPGTETGELEVQVIRGIGTGQLVDLQALGTETELDLVVQAALGTDTTELVEEAAVVPLTTLEVHPTWTESETVSGEAAT